MSIAQFPQINVPLISSRVWQHLKCQVAPHQYDLNCVDGALNKYKNRINKHNAELRGTALCIYLWMGLYIHNKDHKSIKHQKGKKDWTFLHLSNNLFYKQPSTKLVNIEHRTYGEVLFMQRAAIRLGHGQGT